MSEQRVVCAALRKHNNLMIVGPRHFDSFMHKQIAMMACPSNSWKTAEQGFIDQYGNFLTREEAWIIAEKAGQIIKQVSSPGTLYSENLY